ncbi:hypothetical protein EAG18_02205 [Pseudoalteromonas sp. J010]|nr:hypothetical protein EAG18_02205 [Pseudoalteromonas sp. J010]
MLTMYFTLGKRIIMFTKLNQIAILFVLSTFKLAWLIISLPFKLFAAKKEKKTTLGDSDIEKIKKQTKDTYKL